METKNTGKRKNTARSKKASLADTHPQIAGQWHPTKNGKLTPGGMTFGSRKKVWWICSEGHEWKTSVYHRTRGSGCPKCYAKTRGERLVKSILKKRGSLAETHPDIATQWHPTKNGDLTPNDLTSGSGRKAWWLCDEGHAWKSRVANRTRLGHGCPTCHEKTRGEKYVRAIIRKRGSLSETHPDIAAQWHPTKNGALTPVDVTSGSDKKVWWLCDKGHDWKATVGSRTNIGSGCPACRPQTSALEIRVYCELKTIFNDAKWREKIDGIESDIYLAEHGLAIEVDGYPWHHGKEERDRRKGERLLEKGIQLFRIRDEKLARVSETDIFYKENEKEISVIKQLLRNMLAYVSFTPEDELNIKKYLALKRLRNSREYREIVALLPGPLPEESLAHLYPQLAKEWHDEKNAPLNPQIFTPGSGKTVWWLCDEGHEWKASIVNRTQGRGCRKCSLKTRGEKLVKTIIRKRGSLAETHPDIAAQWHPTKNGDLTPNDLTSGSGKKAWWLCNEGHEWEARTYNRKLGHGCPKCYRKM